MPQDSVDVARLIDDRPLGAFHIGLVAFSFLIILADGYDITALAFAGPHLLRDWHIADRSALGPVLSASLAGTLIGAPVLGFVGDRFGRKAAVLASCVLFGVFTLAAAWSTSLTEMAWLRGCAGVGLGGLMPNMIALTGEYAPRRVRATMIIVMFSGVTLGGAFPGFLGNWLIPTHGWPVIFVIGGIVPLVLGAAAVLWLPESLKYLVLREGAQARARRVLHRVAPGIPIGPRTRLVLPDEKVYRGFSPRHLFADGLAPITPLLWLCFSINLMGYYFLISWMPTLLIGQKLMTPSDTATAAALIQVGGTLGGLVLCRPLDTRGFGPVALLYILAVPCVALIGFAAVSSQTALMLVVFLAGFCILGLQFGLNAASAMIYPVSVRSNGSGWAFGIGRFGSVLGPLIGGVLIEHRLAIPTMFAVAAIPYVIGAIACVVLARLYGARFKPGALGERRDGALQAFATEPAGAPAVAAPPP